MGESLRGMHVNVVFFSSTDRQSELAFPTVSHALVVHGFLRGWLECPPE